MCHRRQAFTLIELLVVIAIIAILAAILFPVFAQAKAAAKQSVCLSNVKQLDLSILMYQNDVDDCFPQGEPDVCPGCGAASDYWNLGYDGWQWPCGTGEIDCNEWGNSVLPYTKNQGIFACPTSTINNPFGYSSTTPGVTYTINGVLQFSSSSTATSPAGLVLIWNGTLDNNILGRVWSNPNLECQTGTQACMYVPNTVTNSYQGNGSQDTVRGEGGESNVSKWSHGHGDNFGYVDGHSKWHPLTGGQKYDPWITTGPNGEVDYTFYQDIYQDHTCLFSPDDPCGVQGS